MAKDEIIRFRCSKEQKIAIESAAKASGHSVSAYLLMHCPVATKPDGRQIVATKTPETIKTVATKETNGGKPFVCLLKQR